MGKGRCRCGAPFAGLEPAPDFIRALSHGERPPRWRWITCKLRPIVKNGQGDGIRTRTVRVTGGDANYYITTLINGSPGRTRTDEYEFTKLVL